MTLFRQITLRSVEFLTTLLFVLMINYGALMLLPGDPLTLMFEDIALEQNQETQSKLRTMYGLDGSPWERFSRYALGLLRGDLGFSTSQGAPVLQVLRKTLPWTLLLATLPIMVVLPLGVGVGLEASLAQGSSKDTFLLSTVAITEGLPSFVKATLVLLCFCVFLEWLPPSGARSPFGSPEGLDYYKDVAKHLVAPGGTLILQEIARMIYHIRSGAVGVLSRPFMLVARSKGIGGFRLRYDYLGRNTAALITARTVSMINRFLTGSIFVEVVFTYPGIGLTLQKAIVGRDYPMVQGVLFTLSILILTVNFVGDMMILRLNSRS